MHKATYYATSDQIEEYYDVKPRHAPTGSFVNKDAKLKNKKRLQKNKSPRRSCFDTAIFVRYSPSYFFKGFCFCFKS